MSRAGDIYAELLWLGTKAGAALFDTHVAASIMALAVAEAQAEGTSLCEAIGLDDGELAELIAQCFPEARIEIAGRPMLTQEEQALRDILWMNAAQASVLELLLARMIARRCQRPNHLWQDLGLGDRGELSMLMELHFPRLARRNSADMKWKKFFYRMMCSSEGFRLCAAPVCTECDDFEACFGSEDGEALLARIANGRTGAMEARI
ncbi:nitrogen fixation protein NifQ [Novosphingobium album (ex Liu et al. 2023)]|uniref:Nitrogen fixation protein NifQ n=1 Tax=Novosphingobium album (ex Liu et al. 2023) TaxID=3031130 RepID=A0ABT5WS48_9SPHN|nr:nitrogen fixation protein NifQ [Novosphingobium album (ex Liu et al. 2023)]MDE8652880.1 nitrogen fixation protein NifQ [Novosphingobium album (ex Liu et al. 2023)]